ncbi:MAG: 1-deoxy-D-xylulose-5-phosphate reductoisomerase [Bauldia sp.]|nr:1-deoxy-D-xylulose-5-phosphate reductoisomerase [Bauldia sp.]
MVAAAGGGLRRVSLLGATGSIGSSTIDILTANADAFVVEAVTADRNAEELARIALRLGAKVAVVADVEAYPALRDALAGTGIEAAAGAAALVEAAARPADIVVAAIVGAAGLEPTLAAVRAGSDIAIANKECLVCAGDLFMAEAVEQDVQLLPVDSEHNAIFQALEAENRSEVERIVLTASGGPFREWPIDRMAAATPKEALAHPNWSMGPKITIDSATLMNKGLEVIEAHHLFGLGHDEIDVLVHPQSVVHGLVAYRDGSVLAQMSLPDMRVPISHCLWWPTRAAATTRRLDLAALGSLTFEPVDAARFPALGLARSALAAGGGATNILNAANEVAVGSFLRGEIGFLDIAATADRVLAKASAGRLPSPDSVAAALALDAEGRRLAREAIARQPAA